MYTSCHSTEIPRSRFVNLQAERRRHDYNDNDLEVSCWLVWGFVSLWCQFAASGVFPMDLLKIVSPSEFNSSSLRKPVVRPASAAYCLSERAFCQVQICALFAAVHASRCRPTTMPSHTINITTAYFSRDLLGPTSKSLVTLIIARSKQHTESKLHFACSRKDRNVRGLPSTVPRLGGLTY